MDESKEILENVLMQQRIHNKKNTRIFLLDNNVESVQDYCNFLCEFGYDAVGTIDPLYALEALQTKTHDMLIFSADLEGFTTEDFIVRVKDVYVGQIVILLQDDIADTAATTELESTFIHAFYNKSSDLWTFLSLIDSLSKNIKLTEKVDNIRKTIDGFIDKFSLLYQFQRPENLIEIALNHLLELSDATDGFIQVSFLHGTKDSDLIYRGAGKYNISQKEFYKIISLELKKKIVEAKSTLEIVILEDGVVFPLIGFNCNVIGIIFVEIKDMEYNVFNVLKIFTRQASSVINNAMLHGILDRQSEELMRTNDALNKSYLEVIEALRLAVDAKDRYTCGHSERVACYAVEIAKKMDLSEDEIENVRVGGIFHDIGKIAVSDEILLKPSRLTDDEYEKIKIHPTRGGEILSGISIFKEVIPIVECHHEYVNGRGYPRGLKGSEIPLGAKIMALADAFDAMTSNREYHKKITFEEALERIERVRDEQFDTAVIDCFIDILENNREIIEKISEYK
ncbi:MAG: HD-GYP domain-containing protein [Treponemataceae bacterium]